jgi:predicted dehydrogenase
MKIGLIGNSEFANRIMIPAIENSDKFKIGMIGSFRKATINSKYKFGSYEEVLNSNVDAVYISTINSLHKEWIIKSLRAGKHVFVEKPICTTLEDTIEVVRVARETGMILYENYMFVHHNQHQVVKEHLNDIGDVRFFKSRFTVPKFDTKNFRNQKDLGGGAILDLAGYPIKAAEMFFGDISFSHKQIGYHNDLDLYGQASFHKDNKIFISTYFGMDSHYSCRYELHGTSGIIKVERAFTPKKNESVIIEIHKNKTIEKIKLDPDDQYIKSVKHFYTLIHNNNKNTELKSIIKHFRLKDNLLQ